MNKIKRIRFILTFCFAAVLSAAMCFGFLFPSVAVDAATAAIVHKYEFASEDTLTADGVGQSPLTNNGVTAKDGYAYFDGNGYFEFDAQTLAYDSITVSMDVYPESSADYQKLIQYNIDFTYYFQIQLRPGAEGKLNIEVGLTPWGPNNSASTVWGNKALNALTLNAWQNVTVTVDAGYVCIYVDGVLVQDMKCPYTIQNLIDGNASMRYIGKSAWEGDAKFVGGLDNFTVYDQALTMGEVETLAQKTVTQADVTTGLTHYYSFNDTENLLKDASGFGRDASATGSVTATDGKYEGGVSLTEGGYITLPQALRGNAFTFAAWIYPTDNASYTRVIQFGKDTATYLHIMFMNRDCQEGKVNLEIQICRPDAEIYTLWGGLLENSVTLNDWNHIALVVEDTFMRMFINGKPVNQNYTTTTLSDFVTAVGSSSSDFLGKSFWDSDPSYSGRMDEICIYSRALATIDIDALSRGTLPSVTTEPADIETGLTHYYSFDNDTCAGLDNTGNGNDAQIIGSVEDGKYGKAVKLDGGYIQLPNNVVSSTSNAFTFSAWVYATDHSDFQKIFDIGRDTTVFMQIMLRSGEEGKLHIQTGLTIDGDTGSTATHLWGGTGFNAVTMNEWHHIALTVDGNHAVLYVDGTVVQEGDFQKSIADFVAQENALDASYVGKSHFNDPTFKGYLDEILIYSRALSMTDINELYQGSLPQKQVTQKDPAVEDTAEVLAGLKYYYSFDGAVPGIDYSGNKGNAIVSRKDMTLGTDGVNEELGQYLVFDGESDFLVLPENVIPKEESDFTFAAWICFQSMSEYIRIFDFGESGSYFDFRLRSNGRLETTLTNNSTAGETIVSGKTGTIEQGKWQHVAVTVSGSAVKIYVDGQLVGIGNFARALNTFYNSSLQTETQNFIGLSRYGQDAKFKGYMDEIRIYTRTLSQEDVASLATGLKAQPADIETDPTVLVNGEKKHVDYITACGEGVILSCGSAVLSKAMTAAQLKASITLIEGATLVVADNYDFAVGDDTAVETGFTLKIYENNIIVERISVRCGEYHVVSFDTDGGEAVEARLVKDGDSVTLPYVIKDGYELTGYNGSYQAGDSVVIHEDTVFTAEYEERDVTVTVNMRDGTYQTIQAKAGQTVQLGNFGNERIVGIRIGGKVHSLGDFTMPMSSVAATVVFSLTDLNGEAVTYTTYSGELIENEEEEIISAQGNSLALFDGTEIANGVIEMKITASTANDCGILFWASDGGRSAFWEEQPAQYHVALLNWEGWLLIGKVNYGGVTWNCVKDYKIPSFDVNHEYTMKVVLEDSNVKVYLDGELYLDYTETSVPKGNSVGFRCASAGVKFQVVSLFKEETN